MPSRKKSYAVAIAVSVWKEYLVLYKFSTLKWLVSVILYTYEQKKKRLFTLFKKLFLIFSITVSNLELMN